MIGNLLLDDWITSFEPIKKEDDKVLLFMRWYVRNVVSYPLSFFESLSSISTVMLERSY